MKGLALVAVALAAIVAAPAFADWNPGDSHKMHFPQLPDPTGWDVNATQPKVLADDWLCTGSGAVADIHWWGSWRQDLVLPIRSFLISIYSDDRTGPYSKPGELLWSQEFFGGQWTERLYGQGEQGWYDPNTGEAVRPDHNLIFQYNITQIDEPFIQEEGTIYWLSISADLGTPSASGWGWKTSRDHFEDAAVWGDYPDPQWNVLLDPSGDKVLPVLDLAFVITPEPTSLLILAVGGLLFARRR